MSVSFSDVTERVVRRDTIRLGRRGGRRRTCGVKPKARPWQWRKTAQLVAGAPCGAVLVAIAVGRQNVEYAPGGDAVQRGMYGDGVSGALYSSAGGVAWSGGRSAGEEAAFFLGHAFVKDLPDHCAERWRRRVPGWSVATQIQRRTRINADRRGLEREEVRCHVRPAGSVISARTRSSIRAVKAARVFRV